MRRRIPALLVVLALALVACGGDDEATTTSGPGGDGPGTDVSRRDVLDIEVIHLAEGQPPLGGDDEVAVLDPDDPEAAAALFVEGEQEAAAAAVAAADLDGRTLLGGVVHVGCFPAGEAVLAVVEGEVVLDGDHLDPQEGEVECARAVVTSAVVSVATDDLPAGFDDDPTGTTEPTTTTDPDVEVDGPAAGGVDVPGEVVLVEPARYEADDVPGPGLIRDRVDLEALYGRYGLGEPDPVLGNRLEAGQSVLVAGFVTGGCQLPEGGSLVRTETGGLEWVFDLPPQDPGLACDEAVSALVVVAVDPADVEGVTTVDGDPAAGPTGVGVVRAVEPLDVGAEPSAARFDGFLDLSLYPGLPDIDLPAIEDGAVRLVFVVEACQPDTAELVADLGAGTVRAEAQQSGPRVDCDAESPYLVIADLAPDHADLDPVTA